MDSMHHQELEPNPLATVLPPDIVQLSLLQPPDLQASYSLPEAEASQLGAGLAALQAACLVKLPAESVALLQQAHEQLGEIAMTPMPASYHTGTTLKSQQAQALDALMRVQHVQAPKPALVVVASLLQAASACFRLLHAFPDFDELEATRLRQGWLAFAALLARIGGLPLPVPATASAPALALPSPDKTDFMWVWQQGHWVFLSFIQGLALTFRGLGVAAERAEVARMRQELETATQLMWAAGAAMKLAGNFEKQIYQEDIRPTMMVGHPKSQVETEISGIMHWDHNYLVNVIWKKEVAGLLRNLPPGLEALHRDFVIAYKDGLSAGHIGVCARFGGRETSSLLSSGPLAVAVLEKIENNRVRQIDPLTRVTAMVQEAVAMGGWHES